MVKNNQKCKYPSLKRYLDIQLYVVDGSVFLPLGTHIFVGTLCTSLVLLLTSTDHIVGRLIEWFVILSNQESDLATNESQEEEPEHKMEQPMN